MRWRNSSTRLPAAGSSGLDITPPTTPTCRQRVAPPASSAVELPRRLGLVADFQHAQVAHLAVRRRPVDLLALGQAQQGAAYRRHDRHRARRTRRGGIDQGQGELFAIVLVGEGHRGVHGHDLRRHVLGLDHLGTVQLGAQRGEVRDFGRRRAFKQRLDAVEVDAGKSDRWLGAHDSSWVGDGYRTKVHAGTKAAPACMVVVTPLQSPATAATKLWITTGWAPARWTAAQRLPCLACYPKRLPNPKRRAPRWAAPGKSRWQVSCRARCVFAACCSWWRRLFSCNPWTIRW